MQTFRTIGLVLLGVVLGAGAFVMRDTVRAQGVQESGRITVTPVEWSGGVPYRFIRDSLTRKCYLAALHTRDTNVAAMVEAPGACQ
jgi:hypothetical protein